MQDESDNDDTEDKVSNKLQMPDIIDEWYNI